MFNTQINKEVRYKGSLHGAEITFTHRLNGKTYFYINNNTLVPFDDSVLNDIKNVVLIDIVQE